MEVKIDIYTEALDRDSRHNARMAEKRATRQLISRVFGKTASIEHDSEGRPSVAGVDFTGMISITHSCASCLLAVTHRSDISIGIDAETWREQLTRVASKFLTDEERTHYLTPALLLLAWTTKEAVYKAARIPGLALKEIQLPVPVAESASFTATARGKKYTVMSHSLSPTEAITTAYTHL